MTTEERERYGEIASFQIETTGTIDPKEILKQIKRERK